MCIIFFYFQKYIVPLIAVMYQELKIKNSKGTNKSTTL
jgi:hypothetical protein